MHARLLLAAIAFPAFTLSAQRHGGAAPSGAAIAAPSGSARLHQARARSASIDADRFDVRPANRRGGDTILHRLRSSLLLGVLDAEAADDMGLPGARFTPYPTPVRGASVAYAESAGTVYPAKRAIEKPDAPPVWRPVSPSSGCWWMWVFTGVPICS